MNPFCIAIFGTMPRRSHAPAITLFINKLLERRFRILIERTFAMRLDESGVALPAAVELIDRVNPGCGAVLSLGGDGTFLRCAQWLDRAEVPIVGINTGHLGFLSVFGLYEADALANALIRRDLEVDHRELLQIDAPSLPEGFWPYALNEVAILKEETASMITVHTRLDGFYLTDYLVDGLVISTPTGSTGYNLAIGGPILQPTLGCWVISPIAPHTLTMRPLAVSGDSVVTAKAVSRSGAFRISLDGRSFPLPSGSEVRISRAPFKVLTMRRAADNFASTLRSKLMWGSDSRYSDRDDD